MDKYNKLLKNSGIFFIANFGSKVLTFLLVRFYTEVLNTSEYGTIDLLNTTASLAFPIVTLCITEAVLRFSLDDIDHRQTIFSNGLLVTVLGNAAFVLLTPLLMRFEIFSNHIWLLYLLTLTNSLFTVTAHFARGIGESKLFAASGLLHTFFQIGLNLLFLLVFSWGVKGYILASILSNVITMLVVMSWGKLWKYIIPIFDAPYLKQMLMYAMPLIPNAAFWWVMQSSDRYVIAYMLSASENGLYSAANKIPTIISTISTIFFQAWQISSVDEAKSEDKANFYSNVFHMLSMLLLCATSFIMVILQPFYHIFVEASYYSGWQCAPFLMCAMIFSCYSSFLGTNYVAMKKTNGVFATTVAGAVVNVVLNLVLTPVMGIYGTALATVAAFFVTWLVRAVDTRQFVKIQYPLGTFIIPTVLVLAQAVLLTAGVKSMLLQLVFLLVLIFVYRDELLRTLQMLLKGGRKIVGRG